MRLCQVLFSFFVFAAPTVAEADDFGDPIKGRAYAQKNCSECHAVTPDVLESSYSGAPTFKDIAIMPSTTRNALTVWFRSPHPTMPNLVLEPEDLDNVISYILSLKN